MRDPLPAHLLLEHLPSWGLADASVTPIAPGMTADVFLVTRDEDRWVAKCAYDRRTYFERGLLASEAVAAATQFSVATPLLTADGERVVMVAWPLGHQHPLAILRYVAGDELTAGEQSARTIGSVCAHVHRALLALDPRSLGFVPDIKPFPTPTDGWDLGAHGWLDDVFCQLIAQAADSVERVRWTVGVWDGPDIRADGETVGLIDFGHTQWLPLVHAVANRSLVAAYRDRLRLDAFFAGLGDVLPLTDAEWEVFDLYRLINAGIYARAAAAHPSPGMSAWLVELIAYLRSDLPRVGLAAPPNSRGIGRPSGCDDFRG